MSSISIDLRTKIVRPDTQIWRIFPGQGYAFLETFIDQSKVFLDLPSAILPKREISDKNSHLRNMVKRSYAIADYFAAKNDFLKTGKGSAPTKPPNDLQSYETRPTYKRVGNGVSAIVSMFEEAKQGDMIVMPEPPGERMVRIGEFSDNPEDRELLSIDHFFENYQVNSRSVRWLARVDEPKLPRRLTDSLRHQVEGGGIEEPLDFVLSG